MRDEDEFDESDAHRAWLAHPLTEQLLKGLKSEREKATEKVFAALRDPSLDLAAARYAEGYRFSLEFMIKAIEDGR